MQCSNLQSENMSLKERIDELNKWGRKGRLSFLKLSSSPKLRFPPVFTSRIGLPIDPHFSDLVSGFGIYCTVPTYIFMLNPDPDLAVKKQKT